MNGMGNNINTSGNSSFPSIGEFEIGTFVAPTAQSAGNAGDIGSSMFKPSTFNNDSNGSQFGAGGRNVFGQSQSGRPIAGPGIRETGIIEKLLVRIYGPITLYLLILLKLIFSVICVIPSVIFPCSILTDLFSVATDKLDFSFTFRNLTGLLSI